MSDLCLGFNATGTSVNLLSNMSNRHGLITGATGTGKTVTSQTIIEAFSKQGVPCFTADVKGDLAGLAAPGNLNSKIESRIKLLKINDYINRAYPVNFWDVYGKKGLALRTTVSEFGPILLANVLELNESQAGLLQVAFSIADDQGLLLLDLKDLKALLVWMSDNSAELQKEYGNLTKNSIAAIQRKLLALSELGGEQFFAEPALDIRHLLQKDFSGFGVVNVLDASSLISSPKIYATFLLWLLSELFEELDEVGDQDLPRLVFFFDEAHLLFDNAPRILLEKIGQIVRLIRSKGVGVFFVTQHPLDIPDEILGQLGNKIQHALRAFSPKDEKAIKVVANSFRENANFKVVDVIAQLEVGEALVSVLDSKGQPSVVERVMILPPASRIGALTETERLEKIKNSVFNTIYDRQIDRESAYETLAKRQAELEKTANNENRSGGTKPARGNNRQSVVETFFKSVVRTVGTQLGKQILRGILGTVLRR